MITNLKIGYGGRLGNQMFQYAMLMGVAAKTGHIIGIPKSNTETIKPDGCKDLFTEKWIPYRFDLTDCFNMKINWIDETEKSKFTNCNKEKFFHFDESVFSAPDNTDFDGYYQSIKYFEHILPDVIKTFEFHNNILSAAVNFRNKMWVNNLSELVSIHVRRGDYLGIPDILPVREPEYFEEALSYFTDKEYNFAIFSDDIPWCKETFGENENIYYSEGNSVYVDMCAMSLCEHHIISNSTFSLWAALLNNHPYKKVIAPKNWFGPKLSHYNTNDLMPKEYIRI